MPYRKRFFRKIVILVFLLLLPLIVIYSILHQFNLSIIKSEIESSSRDQLRFFLSQVENNVSQLMLHSVTLTNDSVIREMMRVDKYTTISEEIAAKKRIEEKLTLYSTSSPWQNNIAVYSPLSDFMMTTYPLLTYEMSPLTSKLVTRWSYVPPQDSRGGSHFTWYTVDPPAARSNPAGANLIVEVKFHTDNLRSMLDQYKSSRNGNPLFYSPGQAPIAGKLADQEKTAAMYMFLESRKLGDDAHSETVSISGESYLLTYQRSASLDWYVVDFVPIENLLAPIMKSRNVFFAVIAVLLIMGISISFVIYRNVQLPIEELIHKVQKLKRGDYSARLQQQPKNEFYFLFNRFNEMAEQIQRLIENVYKEQLRSREAIVKQLQSQINPHFFYNCLSYIVSMSRLDNNRAVEAMATSLGDYYRYTTRNENQMASLGEELTFVQHYLKIQQLRLQVQYEVDVPASMTELPFPRLLLQPIAENSIVHGLESKRGPGMIVIRGEEDGEYARLIVDDNGIGLSEEELLQLRKKCVLPLTEEMGCGVWNVHQRLVHIYGGSSGLLMEPSELGGLKVILTWRKDASDRV